MHTSRTQRAPVISPLRRWVGIIKKDRMTVDQRINAGPLPQRLLNTLHHHGLVGAATDGPGPLVPA